MTKNDFVNRQKKGMQNGKLNGYAKHHEEKIKDEEFSIRESPLTILLASSPHIRAIYHILVVILLVLICDTFIFDLVESEKINKGPSIVTARFGGIGHGIKLWVYDFCVVMSFYPLLLAYSWTGVISRKYPVLRPTVVLLGVVGIVAVEVAVATVPVYELSRKRLELASSTAVVIEMFRFMMKLVSVASACGPRCVNGNIPLPTFKHYVYFMFAPTLLYRDQYPRTKKIRWGLVMFHFMEVGAIIFSLCLLWERFFITYWDDYGKDKTVEAGALVRIMFASVLPGTMFSLSFSYLVYHAWQNAWAEMLRFGDRLFYEDWWTSSNLSQFYRRWNRVVHSWLRDHIYLPLVPDLGRPLAIFSVFFVSSIAHEVIITLIVGFFYPVMLVELGVLSLILMPLTQMPGRRYPKAFNILMLFFFITGHGILWSLYPMELFVRRNCPPSENVSFFIPKSWTYPEVIFKPETGLREH